MSYLPDPEIAEAYDRGLAAAQDLANGIYVLRIFALAKALALAAPIVREAARKGQYRSDRCDPAADAAVKAMLDPACIEAIEQYRKSLEEAKP